MQYFFPSNTHVLIAKTSCNDKGNDRMAYNSIVGERALREIYLMPFMIAQRDAKPIAYMTRYARQRSPSAPIDHDFFSYGRVDGVHVSEDPRFIGENGILRKEWGFRGLVMSDW